MVKLIQTNSIVFQSSETVEIEGKSLNGKDLMSLAFSGQWSAFSGQWSAVSGQRSAVSL
ncbi:MAG: hypothetical protein KME42_15825 [Tildeniella nuda ZEHNDER 1965/U140]|nr:hypothetical protein [Tildeniella nuda ZEHNDER 1965/U140]